MQKCTIKTLIVTAIKVWPEKVQPFLTEWELLRQHQCKTTAKDSGLECTCVKNDDFSILVSGGDDNIKWACALCGHGFQNDWVSRAMNLHQILHEAWLFLHENYWDDSETCSYGQLVIGSCITMMHPLMHHISCIVFWWNFKSSRWLRPSTAQIWCPATSGFSQN